ncbi:hypothetical protein NDU88_000061 [Pleurodeles waltl]|uniref:Uncharacterized protein n=1 Tax=Pleurodeles waltl TaxID=8319 RepID=A0AAV7VV12_PLEWA|nr:hypothetical protein NDU88_000061 [Pleurodeles waltl]
MPPGRRPWFGTHLEPESACLLRGGLAAYLTPTSRGLEWRRGPQGDRHGPEKQPDRVGPCTTGRSNEAPREEGGRGRAAPGPESSERSQKRPAEEMRGLPFARPELSPGDSRKQRRAAAGAPV